MTAPAFAPLSLPPSCLLYIDGTRYADGQPGEADNEPVALDDLTVQWGRDNTLDQPSPATCTFRVLDIEGGQRFLDRLRLGARIDIRADATVFPDPTESTIPLLYPWPTVNGVVTAGYGTPAVTLMTTSSDAGALQTTLPPLEFSSDPSAWDAVPRALAGQTWRLKAQITFPAAFAGWHGYAARVTPIAYWTPGGLSTVMTQFAQDVGPDGVVDISYVPMTDSWQGFQIRVWPTGPDWLDLDATAWSALGAVPSWDGLATFGLSGVEMLAPAAGANRIGNVFYGRITDMSAQWDETVGGTIVNCTAQDDMAELGNRYVGDIPWAVEGLAARFGRIVAASGQPINYTVDPGVAAVQVSYRDVDAQPTAGLLQGLAQSVAGVLWAATSITSGPFLRVEDINSRAPLYVLQLVGGVVVIVVSPTTPDRTITLDSCSLLLDPIEWTQDSTDSSTRVALQWKEQTVVDGKLAPTQKTVTAVDLAAEAATGRRRVSVSTELVSETTAQSVAEQLLGRLSAPGWRVAGLVLDLRGELLDAHMISAVMTILDGATRLGLGIILDNLPGWSLVSPGSDMALYLEGGRFVNRDGAWRLELLTSSAGSQGAPGVAWQDLPAEWSWDEFDPGIAWSDLAGVGI